MIRLRLVDRRAVRMLLADWYFYWMEFAVVFRRVVATLHDSLPPPRDGGMPEPRPQWIEELDYLEGVFYPADAADPLSRYYHGRLSTWEADAVALAKRLQPLLEQGGKRPASEQAEA